MRKTRGKEWRDDVSSKRRVENLNGRPMKTITDRPRSPFLGGTLALVVLTFANCTRGPSDGHAGPEAAPPRAAASVATTVPLAVTFDDLPSSAGLSLADLESLTDDLLAQLAERRVPATGFVNAGKLAVAGEEAARTDLLRRWLAAGHDLGNHGAEHLSLHHVPVEDFLRDVEDGEPVLRKLLGERGQTLRFFRHPYLRTGHDRETKDTVDAWLAERGYTVGAVTLENSDWMFAVAYRLRLEAGDRAGADKVAEAYLDFSRRLFEFWEGVSKELVGAAHPQVLLLHANRLNADTFGDLADLLERRGYRYAPLEEVLADPVYERRDGYVGPAGVLWQFRWAKAEGKTFDWREEPEPPDWIAEIFERSRS